MITDKLDARPVQRALRAVVLSACGLAAQAFAADAIKPPEDRAPVITRMQVTGYCDCELCGDWHRDRAGKPIHGSGPLAGKPKLVGHGTSANPMRFGTLAADIAKYPYGTIMEVPGYGYGVVEDMWPVPGTNGVPQDAGSATQQVIRAWFPNHSRAVKWGRQTLDLKVWQPAWNLPADQAK